jgi:predicted Ser/Thr protein kinase
VKRPLLQYEAAVIKALAGHPGIPEVFAYGRVKHFELLSMQLLHRSLGDVVRSDGPLSAAVVLDLADQLVRSCSGSDT